MLGWGDRGHGDRSRKGRITGVGSRRGEEVEEAKESGGRGGEEKERGRGKVK